MQRRTLLGAVASGSVALGGCLSITADSDPAGGDVTPTATAVPPPGDTPEETTTGTTDGSDDRRYEECPLEVIPYEDFPGDVRDEIDAALESPYEADRVYLREAMAVDESYVAVGDAYFEPSVAIEGDSELLTLDTVEPKALPDPRPVAAHNRRDGERTVTLEVVADDGTILLDQTRELRSGSETEFGRIDRVGSHELRVVVANDHEIEDEVMRTAPITRSRFSVLVIVDDDGIGVTGVVADLGVCRFES